MQRFQRGFHNRSVFESSVGLVRRRAPSTFEVREMLEVAESFSKRSDRVDYLSSVGIDYDRASTYLPVVESLNRQWNRKELEWWKFVYDLVVFTVAILAKLCPSF